MTACDLHPALRAHSHIGAQGWTLGTLPAEHPPGAIGIYHRGKETAWLIQEGREYRLEPKTDAPE